MEFFSDDAADALLSDMRSGQDAGLHDVPGHDAVGHDAVEAGSADPAAGAAQADDDDAFAECDDDDVMRDGRL